MLQMMMMMSDNLEWIGSVWIGLVWIGLLGPGSSGPFNYARYHCLILSYLNPAIIFSYLIFFLVGKKGGKGVV